MPLTEGTSPATFKKNIEELVAANKSKPAGEKRPMKQIVAIAYAEKRKGAKKRKK